MTPLRRRKIVAALRKLTRRTRSSSSQLDGPGCTCESCVQAWDRQHRVNASATRQPRKLKLRLY